MKIVHFWLFRDHKIRFLSSLAQKYVSLVNIGQNKEKFIVNFMG